MKFKVGQLVAFFDNGGTSIIGEAAAIFAGHVAAIIISREGVSYNVLLPGSVERRFIESQLYAADLSLKEG